MLKLFLLLASLGFATLLSSQKIFELTETHPINFNGTLILQTEDADVEIIGTDRSDVYVDIYRKVKGTVKTNKKFDIEIFSENGDLTIREKPHKGSYSYFGLMGGITYTVKIEVPKTILLDIKGEDDDYVINNVKGDISLYSEDGDVKITNTRKGSINLNLEDGDIFLSDVNGNLSVKSEDGNISIDEANFSNCKLHYVDGNINLVNASINILDVKGEDGDVVIKKSELHEAVFDTEDGDIILYAHLFDDSKIKIRGEDGDVRLHLTGSGFIADVSYGDGDVDYDDAHFQVLDDSKHSIELKTKSEGRAQVRVRTEDGDVDFEYGPKVN